MTYRFALQLFLILILLSGLIAFIGNYVGRYFGKKRLTIFNMRPRNTAFVFTLLSGIIIMAVTFITLVLSSQDVRTAFFGMEKLQKSIAGQKLFLDKTKNELLLVKEEYQKESLELSSLKKQVEKIKAEKEKINLLKNKLLADVNAQKTEDVIFKINQPIDIRVINAGQGYSNAETAVYESVKAIKGNAKKFNIHDVVFDNKNYASTISYIAALESDAILITKASNNTVYGGQLKINFEALRSKLIYRKGEQLFFSQIERGLTIKQIEEKLLAFASSAMKKAQKDGVIPGMDGAVGHVSEIDIFNAARRVKGFDSLTNVSVLADSDIYSQGPVKVLIKVNLPFEI